MKFMMADTTNNTGKISDSPIEDYNPLVEDNFTEKYLRQASNDPDWEEDENDDSEDNVDDGGPVSDEEPETGRLLGQQYSITPPAQPRVRKREKERFSIRGRHLDRSYKELLNLKRQQQPKTVVNVIKNEYLSDPALCNLSEFDSDDNLDRDMLREKKEKKRRESKEIKKTMSKLRISDREEKRLSEDFSVMSVNDSLGQAQLSGLKLEGSGRFANLKAKTVLPLSPECRSRREISDPPPCPKNREDFYVTFSHLVNLGTEAKKDKEKMMSSCKRQISVEQEQRRSFLIEKLWLELRAYLDDGIEPEEERQRLLKERQKNDQVIDDINNFSFTDTFSQECPDSAFIHNSSDAFFSNEVFREQVNRSVSASFSDVNLTDETVNLQTKALIQVHSLLERLDQCERCYSTTKAFGQDKEKYQDPLFQRRVKCLNLWLNITCDLCQKLKLFGRIIAAHSRGIQWPLVHFEFPKPQPTEFLASPRASIPVLETEQYDSPQSDDDDEEEEEVEEEEGSKDRDGESKTEAQQATDKNLLSPHLHKHVKFLCGDDCSEHSRSSDSRPHSPVTLPSHEPTSPVNSSTPLRNPPQSNNLTGSSSMLSISRASSEMSLDDSRIIKSSIYRHYVEKCLRKMGPHRLNLRLRDLFHRSLNRAKEALERPKDAFYSDSSVDVESDQLSNEMASSEDQSTPQISPRPPYARGSSLSEHGEWSQQFIEMGLPSFRPTYLFIVRIQLDVIHECLKLRKDQRPIGDPSFLSIGQLIRECKEVLKGAALVKQYYYFMVEAVMWDEQEAEAKFETDLTEFDDDMKSMLDVYFSYLQSWSYMLQSLPEAPLGMKSALEEEWNFTKSICAYVMGGEAEAGKKFSSLASSLLSSIADFLDNGIDANTRNLYDEEALEDGEDEEDEVDEVGDVNDNIEDKNKSYRNSKTKQNVQRILRSFRNLFNEARERASKALGFAKLLRKDLEIAADFNVAVTSRVLLQKLKETNHVQVRAPLSTGYMMFIPSKIISNRRLILQLLNVTTGRDDPADHPPKEDGYLLMLRCESGTDHIKECPLWTGEVIQVEPTAVTTIALSHIEVMSLLFVVTHSSTLAPQRKNFENIMGTTVVLVNEQTSCHQSIAESLLELKTNALELMEKFSQAIKQVNEKLNFNEVIHQEENILKLYRETMLKVYDFGFEYQKELMRLISGDQREKQCLMIVSFAKDWMNFVINKCERGRGTRPRWATQGLEFICMAAEPKNIAYLTDEQFKEFQHVINNCLTHIVGSAENRSVGPGMSLSRSNLDLPRGSHHMLRLVSCPENSRFNRSVSSRSAQSEPAGGLSGNSTHSSGSLTSTPSTPGGPFFADNRGSRLSIPELPEMSIMDSDGGVIILNITQTRRGSKVSNDADVRLPRKECLRTSIERLEYQREQKLREKRVIGNVTTKVHEPDIRMNFKRVHFKWQRGIKIGEGQFGKVYTAVNIDTGELMAMKEMKFQPNDQQSLKEICDEIKNFEGINHKNLVKYYGVEVHKDEMLMFMEYCDSGSIEQVARLGLPENMIRRYTQEIVRAVAHLHENNIVHRDIKGANIFLTSEGRVKLGDFGCSVKLKSHQTMLGENHNLVGTTAYMAPEVITQNAQGYGRAADIWSLGCVVLEMTTGKRPWHELEHNLQVMFKVGTGHTPSIPENLSKDGKDFLANCLVHEPANRWTAQALLDHIFVKCAEEENDEEE